MKLFALTLMLVAWCPAAFARNDEMQRMHDARGLAEEALQNYEDSLAFEEAAQSNSTLGGRRRNSTGEARRGDHRNSGRFILIDKAAETTDANLVATNVKPAAYQNLEIELLDCWVSGIDSLDHRALIRVSDLQMASGNEKIFEGWISSKFSHVGGFRNSTHSLVLGECMEKKAVKTNKGMAKNVES